MSHRRRAGEPGLEVTLPITPMLDMSFQLLFFFMATFNPTDPEGAQVLAMAREKKVEEKKTDKMAEDPSKVKDDVNPDTKKEVKKKEEEPEIDNDLKIDVELGGTKEQPHLHYQLNKGAVKLDEGDIAPPNRDKKETWFNLGETKSETGDRFLRKKTIEGLTKIMQTELEKLQQEAMDTAKRSVQQDSTKDYDKELAKELAKQKVRIQSTVELPWGLVFETMNFCTDVGCKTVALSTPKGYEPKAAPKD